MPLFTVTMRSSRTADQKNRLSKAIHAASIVAGYILRDLFEHDDGGWLQDVALLDRLVAEKPTAEAETIAKEGWKWISVPGRYWCR